MRKPRRSSGIPRASGSNFPDILTQTDERYAFFARLLSSDRQLARIEGRIVTSLLALPAEKRNPYLPYAPSPRVRFVLDADAALSAGSRAPSRGR